MFDIGTVDGLVNSDVIPDAADVIPDDDPIHNVFLSDVIFRRQWQIRRQWKIRRQWEMVT